MLEFKDICLAYLEGYIYAKVTENMIRGKVPDSDLDILKEIAVKCMENYISQLEISEAEKEELKHKAHPTFRVMLQSCSAYSLSLKYLSSLKPYALRFITFILLFIPSTLAVEI